MLMPISLLADEKIDQKSQIKILFKEYKTSLNAGNNEKALNFSQQMYAITPDVYGRISKTHGTATFNLAYANELSRNFETAAEYYKEHIEILDELKLPKNENYVFKLGLLSQAYDQYRNHDGAIKYAFKAWILAKKLKLGDNLLGEYALRLGLYHYSTYGKFADAKRYFNKSFNLFSAFYGADHIKTAQAMFWQAKMDMGYKKNRRAAERLENVLAIYNKNLPAGHDKILQTHAFLVQVYEKIGDKDKSTEHCIAVATERPTDFDRELDPLYKITPTYPMTAQRRGQSGYIVAEFTVDAFGQVKDIKTLEGENVKAFEKEAHKALSKFRYAPSVIDGQRVKTEGVLHKITFEMAR